MAFGLDNSIRIETHIAATPVRVWRDLADIATHVEWMDDAKEITFTGSKRQGIGTQFACKTQISRFRMEDQMMVTDWIDNRRMSVQHDGLVKGNGTFTLTPSSSGGTDFSWEENLLFPLHLGGPVGELVARPVLKRMWVDNLASLKDRIEAPTTVNPLAFFRERGIEPHTRGKTGDWTVDLIAPKIADFHVKGYAGGSSSFAARAAAVQRWIIEEEPNAGV